MSFRVVGFLVVLAVGVASWMLTCVAWQLDRVASGVVPLDPREFGRLTLVTLGTAGAAEDHNRRGPSTALGRGATLVLVDAGRGVAESLRAAGIPVSQPDAVLLTHLLPENVVGLDDLVAAAWAAGRRAPIRVMGPPGTREVARSAVRGVADGVMARARALGEDPSPPVLDATELDGDFEGRVGELALRAAPLAGGPVPALAWSAQADGVRVVVSGTGWAGDALARFARGADVLVHEAVPIPTPELAAEAGLDVDPERLRREAALHAGFEETGELARRAGVDTLVLVRLRPPPVFDLQISTRVDDHFDGRIVVADDGDEIVPRAR